MKVLAALLLSVLFVGLASSATTAPPVNDDVVTTEAELRTTGPPAVAKAETTAWKLKLGDSLLEDHAKSFLSPKDMLLQQIHTLEEDATEAKIQDEVAQTLKAESQRLRTNVPATSTAQPTTAKAVQVIESTTEDVAMKKLLEAEDVSYEDDLNDDEDEEDESDDEYNDDDDLDDDGFQDDEHVMTQCPDYCRCTGQYADATTATCSNLVEEQTFGTGIAHLQVENAGEIRLGPNALRNLGLLQLESIAITDTKILELDPTAFHGITYLFAINLTRNGLTDIHPDTFKNNTQLAQLIISGNPLKHNQDTKFGKHGLFDAVSVTEFDFSNNGIAKLKRNAFARMPKLTYVNLKGNRMKEIDSLIFSNLEGLEEVDLSNNLFNEIPKDLFLYKGLQTLRVAGNNLTTLATIKASKLTVLNAANNKIKVIAKDDLAGLPMLDFLSVNNNGMKRIHQHAFTDLEQLTHLDISGNKLISFSEHHLRTNSRLQTLLMNDNPGLGSLPVFKTAGLEYETYSIYRFECANCGLNRLEEGTFNAMSALTRLNLARNRLTALPKGLLSRLSSLRILDLSDNIIKTLESDMFQGATSMSKLSLAGNPLVTLQVTPFLKAPSLIRLDVSRCALERVWSEARMPFASLRFLSVRENLLRRITVEELRAMPKMSGLDISQNPLDCDMDFRDSVQWLTDHGVKPTETARYASIQGASDDYRDSEGITQWTDLAKVVCDGVSAGPPSRLPHKEKKIKNILAGLDGIDSSDSIIRNDFEGDEELLRLHFDHGLKTDDDVENAFISQDGNMEYEDFGSEHHVVYSSWYSGALWPMITVILVTLMVLLLTAHVAIHLAKKRGRGPVLRPPMMLRHGLIDNKNCGLVYKPLQEEIATPHMPKRGSFYSSSTFHYDKIVPESV